MKTLQQHMKSKANRELCAELGVVEFILLILAKQSEVTQSGEARRPPLGWRGPWEVIWNLYEETK